MTSEPTQGTTNSSTSEQPRWVEYHRLSEITPATRNPRLHESIEGVKNSIREVGFADLAIHDGRTNRILAGHGRLQALTEMWRANDDVPDGVVVADDGEWMMPVVYGLVTASDAKAEALLVALNRLTETGGWDKQGLADILVDLQSIDDTMLNLAGYEKPDLDKLLKDIRTELPDVHDGNDLDDVPDLYATARSKAGDVWLLGRHRLAVGDACDPAVVAAAMGEQHADMIFTDPPYGVGYLSWMDDEDRKRLNHRADAKTVGPSDTLAGDDLDKLLRLALGNAFEHAKPGSAWYVCIPSAHPIHEFVNVLCDLDLWKHMIVWVKHRFVFAPLDYHYRHECIMYGWKAGAAHHAVADRTQDTVWEFPMPSRSEQHPTMKPVELVQKALRNSTDQGAVVLDVFAGSGTTIIAAEAIHRTACAVEVDVRYADAICRRFQKLTGHMPVLEGTGEAHDFTLIDQADVLPKGLGTPDTTP